MDHTELLNDLNAECKRIGITLYEYQYHHNVFGSWIVVAGTSKNRMMFCWDGKESYLSIGTSSFHNSTSISEWNPVLPSIGGVSLSQLDVFNYVKEKLRERYNS